MDCSFTLATDEATYVHAIDTISPDVILSDNSLPEFSATQALEIMNQRSLYIPFILVTGTVSEEFAANIIKLGADDYILKDRMAKLPATIISALKQRRSEKEKLEIIEQLKENEKRYRTWVESISDGFIALDSNWNLLYVNKKAEQFLNKQPGYLVGKNMWTEFPKDIYKTFYIAYHQAMETQENLCIKEYFCDIDKWVETNIYPSLTGISVYFRDITEQTEARHKTELAEERARVAIEAANIGTYDVNLVTGNLVTSQRYNEIFGFDESRPATDYLALIHPDDLDIRNKAHEISQLTGRIFYECRILKPDKKLRWIRAEGIILKNEQEIPARLIGSVMDITEVKYLLKQKDDFIGIASHELKTPVTTIKAYTHILEEMLKMRGNIPEISLIHSVDKQVNRLSGLINNLLDATKMILGRLEFNYANFKIDPMVAEIIKNLQLITDKKIILQLSANDCEVYTDKDKIEQIITNLVNNAVKFSPVADKEIVRTFIKSNQAQFEVYDYPIGIKQ